MLVLVSPAKKLDFESECFAHEHTEPTFISKTNSLAKELKKLQSSDLGRLMKLSLKLSDLNYNRFQTFKPKYNTTLSKQAAFAFNGDTYTGLDIHTFSKADLKACQKHLRILSGLYGILKPLDLIQPHRLEMGTKFSFSNYKNLYQFWKSDVTDFINTELTKENFLINCASNEYFDVIDKTKLEGTLITPIFKENHGGELKIISFSLKRARGMLARYIIQKKIKSPEGIKAFNVDNYSFNSSLSTETEFVFTR